MIDKTDRELFLKAFLGNKPDKLEKFKGLRSKLHSDLAFVDYLLYDNPNIYLMGYDGDELDVFEEDGKTICMLKHNDTLYYITEGSAVKIDSYGGFIQINLNDSMSGITQYYVRPSDPRDSKELEEDLEVICNMFDIFGRYATCSTKVPCNARDVLNKLQLQPFTQEQLVKFINENTNQASSTFQPETYFAAGIFPSTGPKKEIVFSDTLLDHKRFKFKEGRYDPGKSFGSSIEDAYPNIQKYLDGTFKFGRNLFDMLTKIDPRLINLMKEQTNLLGDNLGALMDSQHIKSNSKQR